MIPNNLIWIPVNGRKSVDSRRSRILNVVGGPLKQLRMLHIFLREFDEIFHDILENSVSLFEKSNL